MGVHVSPLVIELSAIMKLKITVTSIINKGLLIKLVVLLTFRFDLVKFIREYIDHI